MNTSLHYRIFRSNTSPLASLSGVALLSMASDRLAHAILVTGALVWTYCLSSLAAYAGAEFFPRRGKALLLAFLSSFIAGFYLLLIWILSPLCAMEVFFVISVIPMFCMVSDIFNRFATLDLYGTFLDSFFEALVLGVLIVLFAFIREPLGFLSLSLPGGARGIILLFSVNAESFLPVCLITSSSGALLLLGYFLGLYRYFRAKNSPQEDKE
ncbi:MAG: hypothetical protein LBG95_01585 [Treponema sp.]|jgi:hypothetical protein|nr:hypothetical protein [Treponema sp.]